MSYKVLSDLNLGKDCYLRAGDEYSGPEDYIAYFLKEKLIVEVKDPEEVEEVLSEEPVVKSKKKKKGG